MIGWVKALFHVGPVQDSLLYSKVLEQLQALKKKRWSTCSLGEATSGWSLFFSPEASCFRIYHKGSEVGEIYSGLWFYSGTLVDNELTSYQSECLFKVCTSIQQDYDQRNRDKKRVELTRQISREI